MGDDDYDGVLEHLVGLAAQGTPARIAIQVNGQVITGTVITADAYYEELAGLVGGKPAAGAPDMRFLHLRNALLLTASGANELYRCRLSAVQGYEVFRS